MYLKRDRLILKQIALNRQHQQWTSLPQEKLNLLSTRAHQQLSLNKTINRQIEYFRIELFLELASPKQSTAFYNKLKHDLSALFSNERARKTFESKWTLTLRSNVMACFSRIARDFFKSSKEQSLRTDLTGLYVDTLDKLIIQDKVSKIQEKFLEPFLVQSVKLKWKLEEILGNANFQRLRKAALKLSKTLSQRETPKTLTSNHFLKYCAMRSLQVPLPHEKYLYNQLLHAPNPKYLLPFRCKGSFLSLTNQLLLKSNKLDMVGCLFWNYFEYEEGDLFEKIRRAAQWGGRVDILAMLIQNKIVVGLERCLNLINEKVIHFSSKHITDEGINSLMALVETALFIFKNNSKNQHVFQSALQKLDIRQVFQQPILQKQSKLRGFATSLLQLYFKMIHHSSKKQLKFQSLSSLGCQITRLLYCHQQTKFTKEITNVTLSSMASLSPQERAKFIFGAVETANQDWESSQYEALGNQIAFINIQAVRLIAQVVAKYGFEDQGKADYKMVKLNFYYILSLNFKQSDYFQSKQKLSRTILDINPTLTNNTVFRVLQTRKLCYEAFITHLASLYGIEVKNLGKLQYEGLLAAIDELVTYRIQQTKALVSEKTQISSFYSLLVSFLEQVERIEPNGKMFKLVRQYFIKCKKTYLIEVFTIRGRDEGRTNARILITKDVIYLLQGCVSANPKISSFCWEILQQYIQKVPELAIYTEVLAVWAQCISILYRKSNQEYESKSQKLKVKNLSSGILIPTERKQIMSRIKILMCGLYGVILRGHLIDNDYLNVRVQYLIRQTCKSASFGFGWKLLKHLTNSFKDDKEFIAKEILTNNSCSWFVNDDYFNTRLEKVKPQRILLDKYLIPLHKGEIDNDELKKIFLGVQPQVQTQFVTIPPQSSQSQMKKLVSELTLLCSKIEDLQEYEKEDDQQLQQLYSSLFDAISRVKMIYITKWNQAIVFSQILDVVRKFSNFRLLEHTLLKIVPFFYCLNEYNWKIVQTLAELLHFVVSQLNISCLKNTDSHQSDNNTFDPRLNQFTVLPSYQAKELKISGNRHKAQSCHQRRVNNLKLMYGQLVRFFSSHMHVCIAKGFELSLLLRLFSTNFLLQRNILPQLPLQSVCRCLLSQLQLVNVLRSALQRGETAFDGTVVDNFYVKTIKSALFHFQKQDFSIDQQSASVFHNKQLKQRIDFLIQICDYLRNDDFHQLSKKKLPKRNQIFARRQSEIGLQLSFLKRNRSSMRNNLELLASNRRPVSSNNNEQTNLTALRYSLLYFISEQIDRTKAYAYPQLSQTPNPYSLAGKKGFINNSILQQLLSFLTPSKGAILIYNMLSIFGDRVQHPTQLYQQISKILSDQPIYNYPSFLPFYVHEHKHKPEKLRELNYWRSPHIPVLLKYLSKQYEQMPTLQRYVTKVLKQLDADQILFYLPQIFQALTLKSGKIITHFLLQYARKSSCFAHQLIWLAKVQSKQEKDPHNKSPRLPEVDQNLAKLLKAAKHIIKKTIWQFSRQEKNFFYQVNDFYEQVTAISGKMKAIMPPAQKKEIIDQQVAKIVPPKSAYLPFNPTFQVLQISKRSGTPMQSAAKCPFLLTFNCIRYSGPDEYFSQQKLKKLQSKFKEQPEDDLPQEEVVKPMNSMQINGSRLKIPLPVSNSSKSQCNRENSIVSSSEQRVRNKSQIRQISCIFKVFDDIRQDCLALQVIRLFLQIFQRHKLDLKLFPYHTLSNRTGSNLDIGGIIQVVPNCLSRDSIGKTNEQSLYQFFLNNFGPQHNLNFQSARENFIRSQAAYSIVSYILQVKDRHNGNILIDKQQGYLVHIDFGFILQISPAGNLRFERAAFKLTDEMIKIMGGSIQSQPFLLYLTLVIKGFLVARRYHKHVTSLVKLMVGSGLPCFLPKALQNLQNRFFLDLSQIQAAEKMKDIVLSAADHWTTNWYDRIQWMQQKIYH